MKVLIQVQLSFGLEPSCNPPMKVGLANSGVEAFILEANSG